MDRQSDLIDMLCRVMVRPDVGQQNKKQSQTRPVQQVALQAQLGQAAELVSADQVKRQGCLEVQSVRKNCHKTQKSTNVMVREKS